ncbi:MAG TPA: diacylglycerol kinase family protein [Ktedonobacterales bacterium]|nr:diacylglycerol kinase family protein [Ktedonobacterales bacterium]
MQSDATQVVVIVNGRARMGADVCLTSERLDASLRARGLRGRTQPTASEEECLQQIARAADEGAEVVVAAGGDGTVRCVIEGLMRLKGHCPALGILACGTMNNIAASFDIPEDMDAGLDLLAECIRRQRYFRMDVGMVGDEPFVEVAGVGLMARLFPLAEDLKNNGAQASADVIEGLRDILIARPQRVWLRLDGRTVTARALQVTLCNTPSHGARLILSPTARVDDGLLDVVLDERVSGPRMLWDLLTRRDSRLMTRQRRRIFQARRVSVWQPEPWALQMDGVYKGDYGRGTDHPILVATVAPGALRVCAAERPTTAETAETESAVKTLARLLPAATAGVAAGDSASMASVSAMAQGVAQGAEAVGQQVAQTVSRQVERHLASPEHAARRLEALRWVYLPGAALGATVALSAWRWPTLPGDRAILRAIQRTHSPLLDRLMTGVAAPGFAPLSLELLGAGALALWLARLRLESAFLLLAAGGVTLLDTSLKGAIRRKRPETGIARVLRHIPAPSFPSGHTMNYISVFGFLGAASMANVKPSPTRTLLVSACAAMAALIGPARVYLGAHWPSDTAAGYLYGGLYLGGLLELYTRAKLRQAQRRRV